MEEKPRVVITSRARRVEQAGRGFAFTKDMIPQDSLADYRQRAWEVYNRLPLPASPDEAWRRTDLRPAWLKPWSLLLLGRLEDLAGHRDAATAAYRTVAAEPYGREDFKAEASAGAVSPYRPGAGHRLVESTRGLRPLRCRPRRIRVRCRK